MKLFYFTATGNNLYVAKTFRAERYSIPRMIKDGRLDFEDEKIGIVFPVYYLGIPWIVEEFLNRTKLDCSYLFAIATYGFLPGAFERRLLEIGEKAGHSFAYINDVRMVDNYLPNFDMEVEMKQETGRRIDEKLAVIRSDVESGAIRIRRHFPAWNLVGSALKKRDRGFDGRFLVSGNCTGCGICEKVCPAGNIRIQGKPEFQHDCWHCLACIHHCPHKAIRLPVEKGNARFINKNVTLAEIMEANK